MLPCIIIWLAADILLYFVLLMISVSLCAILWTRSRRDPMCTNRISFSALRSFAQNPVLVIFTFETFSLKKELELSRKRTQKMRISEVQKYRRGDFLIVVLTLVGNVDKAQDIT